jgi:hypothetical protein
VRVLGARRALRGLEAIQRALVFAKWPAAARWLDIGVDPRAGVVTVAAAGPSHDAVAAWLAERHGDLVRLTWLGSSEPGVEPVSWQLWRPSGEDPCVITVLYETNSAYPFERVELEETADRRARHRVRVPAQVLHDHDGRLPPRGRPPARAPGDPDGDRHGHRTPRAQVDC